MSQHILLINCDPNIMRIFFLKIFFPRIYKNGIAILVLAGKGYLGTSDNVLKKEQYSLLLFLYVGLEHLHIPAGSKVTGEVKVTTKACYRGPDTGVSGLNKTFSSNVNAYMRSTLL